MRLVVVGFAETVKSCAVKVTFVDRVKLPLVPATMTVYLPVGPPQESVDVCEPLMLEGLRAHLKPFAGDMVEAKLTMPANPFALFSAIVVLARSLASIVLLGGLDVMVKSGAAVTRRVMVME